MIVGKTVPFYGTFFICEKKFVNQKRVELNFCNASCYNYTVYACLLNLNSSVYIVFPSNLVINS